MGTTAPLQPTEPPPRSPRSSWRRARAGVAVPFIACQLAVVLLATASPAHAVSTGSVSGSVRTLTGTPVPDTVVTLARSGGGFTTVTNANGGYSRSGLPFDDYEVQVQEPCFDDVAVPVTVDGAETKDVVLGFEHDVFGHVCQRSVLGTFLPTTPLALAGDDAVQPIKLGFPFPYYGALKTEAFVSTNGFLTFTAPPAGAHASNLPLLDPDTPPDGIFPFWDDLLVDSA